MQPTSRQGGFVSGHSAEHERAALDKRPQRLHWQANRTGKPIALAKVTNAPLKMIQPVTVHEMDPTACERPIASVAIEPVAICADSNGSITILSFVE